MRGESVGTLAWLVLGLSPAEKRRRSPQTADPMPYPDGEAVAACGGGGGGDDGWDCGTAGRELDLDAGSVCSDCGEWVGGVAGEPSSRSIRLPVSCRSMLAAAVSSKWRDGWIGRCSETRRLGDPSFLA